MNAIFKLAPMRGGFAKLIGNERSCPPAFETTEPLCCPFNHLDLAVGGTIISPHLFDISNTTFNGKLLNEFREGFVERLASCYNGANRNHAISMQAFEILQVTIIEWIFIIPLNLKRKRAAIKALNMVDFVRD